MQTTLRIDDHLYRDAKAEAHGILHLGDDAPEEVARSIGFRGSLACDPLVAGEVEEACRRRIQLRESR